ncbi:MAG TPA: hypothetical protein VIC85_08720 [Ktedonobacterales bacterium]
MRTPFRARIRSRALMPLVILILVAMLALAACGGRARNAGNGGYGGNGGAGQTTAPGTAGGQTAGGQPSGATPNIQGIQSADSSVQSAIQSLPSVQNDANTDYSSQDTSTVP